MNTSPKELMLFSFCFCLFFLLALGNHDPKRKKELNIYKQELKEKEQWLHSELHDIDAFLNQKQKHVNFTNREVNYMSQYVSPEYDEQKLTKLYGYLIGKGWRDITSTLDKDDIQLWTGFKTQNTIQNTNILCKNKATLIFYTTNLKDDYKITIYNKVGTAIHIFYSYSHPCYALQENKK